MQARSAKLPNQKHTWPPDSVYMGCMHSSPPIPKEPRCALQNEQQREEKTARTAPCAGSVLPAGLPNDAGQVKKMCSCTGGAQSILSCHAARPLCTGVSEDSSTQPRRCGNAAHQRLQRADRKGSDTITTSTPAMHAPNGLVLDSRKIAHQRLQRRQRQVQPVHMVLAERCQPHLYSYKTMLVSDTTWECNFRKQQHQAQTIRVALAGSRQRHL